MCSDSVEDTRDKLAHIVEHAAHLLPAQGPIGVFIHHNTLHAFQHLPFEDAVRQASEVFGTEPYLREEAYRSHLSSGRIRVEDIESVIAQEPNEPILPGRLDRRKLRRDLLVAGQRRFEPATIQWHLEETPLLENGRELFAFCQGLVEHDTPATPKATRSPDLDEVIHPFLIRLCGAFLDQGMAYWPMPNRHEGFLRCVRALLSPGWALFPAGLQGLATEFRRQLESGADAPEVVATMLRRMGVPQDEWDEVVTAELLALRGWAGMFHRLEQEPELAPHERVPCSLMDYLAVRLTMTAVASARAPKRREKPRPDLIANIRLAEAARLFDAFQILVFTAPELGALGSILRQRLVDQIASFDELERRRVLHLAYELRHERDIVLPLSTHRRLNPPVPSEQRPSAQVFFCIDEREESMRRHLEEIAPTVQTLSAAGFFGVAMDYAGIDDAHGVPLCPVVIKPQHAVREFAIDEHKELQEVRRRRRKSLSRWARNTFLSSRTLIRGGVATAGLGLLSILPLAARVLDPRRYEGAKRALQRRFLPQPRTELSFSRTTHPSRFEIEKLLSGFSTEEKVQRVASVLSPAGLRQAFSRIVVVLGHGSTSLNNPHESAHDCGACGGRRGGPNGRLYAAMANRPEVREGLIARGIHIPQDTWFVGGYHDTCNDDVELYDLEQVPASHAADLDHIRTALNRARQLDALERSRRFEAARGDKNPESALRHVQSRASHLAEPRPEYGHATNAVCIVGRREVTRGLFLDRRAFLISYDPIVDGKDEGLAALLGAAMPVCAGISLEYYFSYVDNEGYGCGTKLPHNITGLIGVMNGHASDLRTGLPLQMVEVHEPVRILFVLETTPERLMKVISANAGLSELVQNRWIRLATLDPDTGEVHVRRDHGFERLAHGADALPSVAASVDWFRGKLQHLPIARIEQHVKT